MELRHAAWRSSTLPDPQKLPKRSSFPSFVILLESAIVLVASWAFLGHDLAAERHFVDESAYVSQAFYFDLYVGGRWDHPAWLDYAGFDLPPLPKYLIGASIWGEGLRRPDLGDARVWYATGRKSEFAGSPLLIAGRRPMVVLGAAGCLGMFWLGLMIAGRPAGWVAAALLAINPLYRMHARRAMSDVPAEAFVILALVLGLVAWRRAARGATPGRSWACALGAGVVIGLATLAKLNGVLAGLVLVGWVGLALVAPGFPSRSRRFLVEAGLVAAPLAFGTFVALNPYLIARPRPPVAPEFAAEAAKSFAGRVATVFDHRATVSRRAMELFPRDALPTLRDRAAAVAVQGFGRFGPFGPRGWTDSTVRYDWAQDWGAPIWLLVVALGVAVLGRRGRREARAGRPPLAWLPLVYLGVVLGVITPFLPLAWDRYFLAIQAPAILVVATALGPAFGGRWLSPATVAEDRP